MSTALTRTCDTGVNNAGSGIERSICPLRIVVIEQGRGRTLREDRGCYINPPDASLLARNRGDSIQAAVWASPICDMANAARTNSDPNCREGNNTQACDMGPGDFPTTPVAANPPAPTASDIVVGQGQI